MNRIQEELAKGLSTHAIMEVLCTHTEKLGSPFYLSDLMIFETLLDEFYRQKRPVTDLAQFLSIENVIHLVEKCDIPNSVKDAISDDFIRLTGITPNRFALSDLRAKERYRHALTVIYSL